MDDYDKISFWQHARSNIIGLIICVLLFGSGFFIHGNVGLYLNLSGFIIVIGGTFGATFLSFRMERLLILLKVLRASYGRPAQSPDAIVDILVELSVKKKIKGILTLQEDEEETTIVFLRQAIGFLVDGYSAGQIRESLSAEMYFFKMRRGETLRVLQTMAEVAPSFGLVGSVVGLIGMLAGVGDNAVILSTVPIALTSTLYGIVLANFFFLPFAANIRERTVQELNLQRIIAEGVSAMAADMHPRLLDRKLKSFLTPSARQGELISLARIKERFEKKEEEQETEEPADAAQPTENESVPASEA